MKKIFALVATVSLMFSCSQEEIIPDIEKIPINISVGQQTRANDSTYENEDEVGIYVVNYDGSTAGSLKEEGNQVDNAQFTFDGSKWSPENSIYWKDKSTAADFYAYYPYSESTNISAHPFSVQANQSSENAFWASDFLWGKATKVSPTKNAVPIVTNHSLSRILVDIKPGNGFTAESWAAATKSVKICDVKTSATIDLSTGIATATGNNGEIIPLAAAETGTTLSYKAMIVPQVVADNSKLVVVTVDGTDYVYRKGYTFQANTQHTFTVTVNKSGSNVDVTIGEWTIDDTTNEGDAEDESESEAIIPNNQIWYTATAKVEPYNADAFGATIVSNEWNSSTGKGIITFDGDIIKIEDSAFILCKSLTDITIPESVMSITGAAFDSCSNLITVYCHSTIPPSASSTPFNEVCTIYVPNSAVAAYKVAYGWTTCKDKIEGYDFGIVETKIPNNEIWYKTTDGNTIGLLSNNFNVGIKSNTYENGKGVIVFEEDITAINCNSFNSPLIVSLTLPDCLTEFDKYTYTFSNCYNLKEFNSKFATEDKRCLIVNGKLIAFAPADIEVYSIPVGVESIGESAFPYTSNGRRLYSVTIPESVISIGSDAFYPTHITNIYCKRATPPTGESEMFGNKSTKFSALKIYVPSESVDIYKDAQYWSDYADCIFADPTEN